MKHTKRTICLLAGSALALAALAPMTASAHTHVFLGINLGGLFAPPPVEVYTPPAYYAPQPPPVYYARPAYYAPRVIYTRPEVIYYNRRGWDHHEDRGWHRGWYRHDDHDWHRHWRHHDDNDDN
ncbi:MAG: hypothetical protein ACREPK_00390 [Rhodanobacteraceae bacterium]